MTIHVVPVGLSVLDNLKRGVGVPESSAMLRLTAVQELEQLRDTVYIALREGGVGSTLLTENGPLARVRESIQLADWQPKVSAECTSLDRRDYRRENDIVLLVTTDTVDGLQAALLNAARLATVDNSLYLESPAALEARIGALVGRVAVVRIPQMDLTSAKNFNLAMQHLGTLGRHLFYGTRDDVNLDFHLSGGYKAALPFFLALAEGVRSLRRGNPNVCAFMLHESTLGDEILVNVPLRYIRNLEEHRADLAAANKGERPKDLLLQGYAYEESAHDAEPLWRLTPFGHGLLTLLQATPQNHPDPYEEPM